MTATLDHLDTKPLDIPSVLEALDRMEDTSRSFNRPMRNSSRESIDKLRLAIIDAANNTTTKEEK